MNGYVLLISYHFPPVGGAGAQRSSQLVRRLPALGYRPIVITGPGAGDNRWTPRDPTLADGQAASTVVCRLPGPEPSRTGPWNGKLERWLHAPSAWQRWWMRNTVAEAIGRAGTASLVHATLAPYATAGAALEVGRRLGVPLVVDLEDPWALDEMVVYPTALHRRVALARMRRVLATADAIIMNTPEAAREVRRFPELSNKRIVSIPNAFDAREFERPPPYRGDTAFRIVHTGSLHTDLGLRQRAASPLRRALGGGTEGTDFLTRSVAFLVEAIDRLLERGAQKASSIELHLAGVLTDADRQSIAGRSYIRVHDFLSHEQAIDLVRSADLLFLPMHDLPPGCRARIVPQKTYEYLASGRRILAAVPDGDARDLLAASETNFLCRPADVGAMAGVIEQLVVNGRSAPAGPASAESAARFECGQLAREVSRLYTSLLEERTRAMPNRRRAAEGKRFQQPSHSGRAPSADADRTSVDRLAAPAYDRRMVEGTPGGDQLWRTDALRALTPRELEVLHRIASGETNREVAAALQVTVHAVKFHLASVLRKLGVHNRTQAAAAYVRSVGTDSG